MSDEVKVNDSELEGVSGGAGSWQQYAKGTYVKSICISSTMSAGVKVDTKAATL